MASKCTLKIIHCNLCLRDTETELRGRKREAGGGSQKEKESMYSKPQNEARQEAVTGMVAPALWPQRVGRGVATPEWTIEQPLIVEAALVRNKRVSAHMNPRQGVFWRAVEVLTPCLGLSRGPSSHSQHQQGWREQQP